MPTTCIIVPCYNEASRLPGDAFLHYTDQTPDVHFCFVDDGSTDQTRTLLESLQAQRPGRIEALILPQNQGKAGAVRAGMLHVAQQPFDYIGFLDADLATPLDAIGDLTDSLNQRAELDLVMGSRI